MLEIKNLTGGYVHVPVLKDVSFTVESGQLVGLIGLNGAGKSTTINEIIGLLTPYSGEIKINGLTLREDATNYRKQIGYIPETPSLYEELTLREHIETVAMAYGIEQKVAFDRVEPLLKMFRLDQKLDWFPVHFSKGMKQKVLIVCALMLDVPVYVVDEPFLGLDPLGIRTLLQVLKEKKEKGAAILMSTHVLDTAEKYCDRFIVLHEGKVIAQGDIEGLRATSNIEESSLEEIYFALTTGDDAHE